MGQHDPLDGLVTYNELQQTATRDFGLPVQPALAQEIADMTGMCRGMRMATDDPLGIGGLLSDASRITQMTMRGGPVYADLQETLLDSALAGLDSFTRAGSLELPAGYRLAFRELGLSIGLGGVGKLQEWIGKIRMYPAERIPFINGYRPFRNMYPSENRSKGSGWREKTGRPLPGLSTGRLIG
jgi:hypothetical protein